MEIEKNDICKTEEELVDMLDCHEPHWSRNWCQVSEFTNALRHFIEQNKIERWKKSYISIEALETFLSCLEEKN